LPCRHTDSNGVHDEMAIDFALGNNNKKYSIEMMMIIIIIITG
jgi:hypothetical protein